MFVESAGDDIGRADDAFKAQAHGAFDGGKEIDSEALGLA